MSFEFDIGFVGAGNMETADEKCFNKIELSFLVLIQENMAIKYMQLSVSART